MARIDRDEEREERIKMEIVVDACNRDERAIGWYTSLADTIRFPFEARCIEEREVSPLEEGEEMHVSGMSSVEASQSEMFVTVDRMGRELGVPLAQLEPIQVDSETEEPVADWHYWAEREYEI
ncbi:calcium-binding protein [Natronorubrum sp. JWXQ-INN-674]|uniref:Calcium-binding protein n=1 Tax=Natronorubrum halalkaliphilum TaxID=2691917 RepID=A0A6B0VI69_9EURY|nr:calcium-binding protein [Natronorubrum halalkaliphilum]MXV60973.1 calcium-binding protein [Natronorubrum halalkaliphilum]